jgi:hypothetical protein
MAKLTMAANPTIRVKKTKVLEAEVSYLDELPGHLELAFPDGTSYYVDETSLMQAIEKAKGEATEAFRKKNAVLSKK